MDYSEELECYYALSFWNRYIIGVCYIKPWNIIIVAGPWVYKAGDEGELLVRMQRILKGTNYHEALLFLYNLRSNKWFVTDI